MLISAKIRRLSDQARSNGLPGWGKRAPRPGCEWVRYIVFAVRALIFLNV